MAADAATDGRPPAGPWRDAWKRLRKHRLAVAGLVFVSFVAVASILAPWISPYDPEVQERWWGCALPPGTTHLDLRNDMVFKKGARPAELEAPESMLRRIDDPGKHELVLAVQGVKSRTLRVMLDGGKITQIGEGGKRHDKIEFSASDSLRVKETGAAVAAKSLEVGGAAPAGIPTADGRRVVMFDLLERLPEDRLDVHVRFGYGSILDVRVRGNAVEEDVPVRANDVVDATIDGRRIEHTHWFGTDQEGRDTLSRVIYGGRISLLIGVVATLVSLVIGVLYGATAGFAGGRVDALMMRVVDVLYALPYIFLVILLIVSFGRKVLILVIALGLVQWLTPSRVVRGQVLSLKRREFVDAATTLGASRWNILSRHLIPNTLGVVVVFTTLTIPAVILEESFLSFIGLTVMFNGRPLESWGALVDYGRQALGGDGDNWWLLVFPAAAMSLTLFSLNFLGDGLRDALDPQQRGRR